jgi:cell division septum initiation protein DivIVA
MHIKAFATIASISILASCNQSAQDQKTKADQAQQVANEKITQANTEAQQKANTAQQEANATIAQANANVQGEAAKAQQVANQGIREANNDTLKLRNDYQVETSKSMSQIDNKLDGLKVKSLNAQPKAKAKFESMLPQVVAQRSTVSDDLANLPAQTSQSLKGYKTKTDKDLADLRKLVDEVAINL